MSKLTNTHLGESHRFTARSNAEDITLVPGANENLTVGTSGSVTTIINPTLNGDIIINGTGAFPPGSFTITGGSGYTIQIGTCPTDLIKLNATTIEIGKDSCNTTLTIGNANTTTCNLTATTYNLTASTITSGSTTATSNTINGGTIDIGTTNNTAVTIGDGSGTTDIDTDTVDVGVASSGTTTLKSAYVLKPNIPCFYTNISGNPSSVTGNGDDYKVPFATEVVDRGGNFASNTFTAPVTGIYYFSCSVILGNITTAHDSTTLMFSSSPSSALALLRNEKGLIDIGSNVVTSVELHGMINLAASDTVTVFLTVSGSTKTVDVSGGSFSSYFQGWLVA